MRFPGLLSLLLATACATALKPIPEAWRTVPEAARIGDLCARVICAERAKSDVRVEGNRIVAGVKALTPAFAAVQSFDVSLDRREVVFSARRTDNLDIGLVSLDGSDIHWLPSERADETDVQWAPRGNKVSYIVHTAGGDIVRTLHIPTSAQVSADFARVDALAWDPAAERYSVVVESPEASQRIESSKYDGTDRRTIVAAATRLDVTSEPIAGALVLRPPAMRYNEKVPVVVWVDGEPLGWSDARAELIRNARVAIAIVSRPPDAGFWSELRKTKWIDEARMYAVNAGAPGRAPAVHDAGGSAARPYKSIIEDENVPSGFYRDEGSIVRVGKVQSFAAGYIAQELRTNGFR